MPQFRPIGLVLLSATLLCGCSPSHDSTEVAGVIRLHDGIAEVAAPGQPNARITPNGDLSLSGKSVTMTAAQHSLIQQYYIEAYKLGSQKPSRSDAVVMCDSLDRLRTTQNDLARQVAAFRPYAEINDDSIQACHANPLARRGDVSQS